MNRLEELGRVDAEKAYTKTGKKNLKAEKKRIVGGLKKQYGGSMGGGMNPGGWSPDPTVQNVVGYNPNRPMRGGGIAKRGMGIAKAKGGSIRRRGGGIAKRGMGIAK
jgi:hypothetical protein